MPTGYTADIKDDTTFKEFALRCARAMGALIMMRDDPIDAPIPDEFEPSDYYQKSLESDLSRQAALAEMTLDEAAAAMERANATASENRARLVRESAETRKRYERMLSLVEAWTPPTKEHLNFKKFMTEQLQSSIDFDCHDADFAAECYPGFCGSPQQWLDRERANVAESIKRSRKSLQEEIDRTSMRNSWVRELRRSLAEATVS